MTKHVDFEDMGKNTPYLIPEGFFDEMQQQVLQQVDEKSHHHILSFKHLSYAVIGIAATVCAFIFIPRPAAETNIEYGSISWIEQISDEDLKAIDDMSEYDIFMN